MANILVIRLSAIGDVAMTIPVIYSIAQENPNDRFTVLTQSFLKGLFINRPPNVDVIAINLKDSEKNLRGLIRFAWKLSKQQSFDAVIDLHKVIRSRIIAAVFRLRGISVYTINKDREGRKRITSDNPKLRTNEVLTPMPEVYARTFQQARLNYKPQFTSLFANEPNHLPTITSPTLTSLLSREGAQHLIGIAPFAKHQGKIYPTDKMEQVIKLLSETRSDIKILLFGAPKGPETELMQSWEKRYNNCQVIAGKTSLSEEIAAIAHLDLLISMDSGNMHFASLVRTKVVSIWGATHPNAGFYGFGQDLANAIQRNDLSCRPCSIFGDRPCHRGDWACLQIDPKTVVSKIEEVLG